MKNLKYGFLVGTAIVALLAGMSQSEAQTANSSSGSASGSSSDSRSSSGAAAVSRGGAASNQTGVSTQTGATVNQTYNTGGQSGVNYTGGTNSYATERSTGDVTIRTTPQVYAPPVSGGNPCTLAVSGGVSVIGWGAAAGGTFVDEACATRQKIAMIHNAGYRGAAKELMCDDRATYQAFKSSGEPCGFRAAFEPAGVPPMATQQPGPVVVTPRPVAPMAAKEYPRCSATIRDNCRS